VPEASKAWEAKSPGMFLIKGGTMQTGLITGPGLGAV
jgi:hypothetical protein